MSPLELATAALLAHVQASCDPADLELHRLGIAAEALPEAHRWQWTGEPCRATPVLRLHALGPHGESLGSWTVRPRLTVYLSSPVVSAPTRAGEIAPLQPGVVPAQDLWGDPIDASAGPWIARTALEPGDPATRSTVQPAPDARAGEAVELSFIRGGLELRSAGKLLTDARIGDPVRVVSHATQRALHGRLVDHQTVRIGRGP